MPSVAIPEKKEHSINVCHHLLFSKYNVNFAIWPTKALLAGVGAFCAAESGWYCLVLSVLGTDKLEPKSTTTDTVCSRSYFTSYFKQGQNQEIHPVYKQSNKEQAE